MFSTHPSVQRRVDKLVEVAGGQDRGKLENAPVASAASEVSDGAGGAGPWGPKPG